MSNLIMLLPRTPWHDGLRMSRLRVGWIRQCSIHTAVVLPLLPLQNRRGAITQDIDIGPMGHRVHFLQVLSSTDYLE